MFWKGPIPYFNRDELESPDTREIRLDRRFAAAFPALRLAHGGPLVPTSVCRTPAYNERIRGHPRSLHLTDNPVHPTDGTMGADLYWETWPVQTKLRFARLAWSMGWSLGLHDEFVHVDRRADLGDPPGSYLEQTIYEYDNWSRPFSQAAIRQGNG